jgi:methylated-DNA-[protein]-cysteine S-methyltransferase
MVMEKFIAFETSYGWCGIVSGGDGIKRIILGYKSYSSVKGTITRLYPAIKDEENSILSRAREELLKYLSGEAAHLDFPIDLPKATPFQRKVWEETRSIPYGDVKTYRWLGERLTTPGVSRAIGNALARNPLPLIIPCHRVIRSDGAVGGFSLPGGTTLKSTLIELERSNKSRKSSK